MTKHTKDAGSKRFAVCVSIAAVILSACATGGLSTSDTQPTTATAATTPTTVVAEPKLSWLLVAADEREMQGMAALAEGELIIDIERRCVYLDAFNETIPDTPIVFVFGTQLVDADQPYIQLPIGGSVMSGDHVALDGGWVPITNITQIPFLDHLIVPESCWDETASEREVYVVSPFDDSIRLTS